MNNLLTRISGYTAIWLSYLLYMSAHAPKGIQWLEAHAIRLANAAEYMKINGYFSAWGFSIWSSCQNCSLEASEWINRVYYSGLAVKMIPYILLNHFSGKDALMQFGPWIDRTVILFTAITASELLIYSTKRYTRIPSFWIGIVVFSLFVTSPWTYKMVLASWMEIYFLMFFLLGLLAFIHKKQHAGFAMFLLAGFFHNHWAAAVACFYVSIFALTYLKLPTAGSVKYIPPHSSFYKKKVLLLGSLLLPVLVELTLRIMASTILGSGDGSTLLTRIGISGSDPHNGGLLGALQFLGGQRITVCLVNDAIGNAPAVLLDAIGRYNCMLSIAGMVLVSVFSVIGSFTLLKISIDARWIVFPLIYAMLLFVTILQQSMSVHLLGYSYIFSYIFAAGILGLVLHFERKITSPAITLAVISPCVLGVILLSIRVSMLAGSNG